SHDPDRQNADDSIEAHCLDDIFPFSEECSQYCNQHNKRKLVCERRGEHRRQNTDQDKKELGPWVKPKPFLPALTAHAVIPAFSNCFFSILQPTKALIADVMIAAANMAIRIPVLAVACMVSM